VFDDRSTRDVTARKYLLACHPQQSPLAASRPAPADPHLRTLDRLRDGRMTAATRLCKLPHGSSRGLSVSIIVHPAARGLCRLAIRSDAGDGFYGQVGGESAALADGRLTLRLQLVLTGHEVWGLAGDEPAGSGKCRNCRDHFGTRSHSHPACVGRSGFAWAIRSSDSRSPFDDGQRCPTHGRNKVTVSPKRRKARFQLRKLAATWKPAPYTSDKRPRGTCTKRRCCGSICTIYSK
jgi:hypothetical protein